MSSQVRHISWTVLILGSVLAHTGCGGGGGGGSDSTASETSATVMLANHSSIAESEIEESADAASARFGFGWRPVKTRDILSLTVAITEVYFQYCEDMTPGDTPEVVLVSDSEFDPPSLTIKQGDMVRWEWTTDTEHTITSGFPGSSHAGDLFDEASNGTGSIVELTFADCGVFPYFSNTEADVAAGMNGLVRVKQNHFNHDHMETEVRHGGFNLGERVMIFSGSFDIDLLNLTDLSQILTTTDIPAAEYCRIFIRIEDPRLVLKRDPDTVITDIRLGSRGRLFLKEHFEVAEGEEILVLLDFDGINLYRSFFGNDGYALSPRLKADIRVIDGDLNIDGTINEIDPSLRSFIMTTIDGEVFEVFVDRKTSILTDDDSDDAASTGAVIKLRFDDLAVDQRVQVLGTTDSSGGVDADAITVNDDEIDTTL